MFRPLLFHTYGAGPIGAEPIGTRVTRDLHHPGKDPDFSLMPGLFPQELRAHVRAFGRFVRLADRVTDDALLATPEKVARLAALDACLAGEALDLWSVEAGQVAGQLRASLQEAGVPAQHARHVLQACRRDAEGIACETWSDLMAYCRFAAAPIGRHLLALCREDEAVCGRPADALCAALRILKQLRDCGDPTIRFNRLCIPRQYLADAMISPAHLRAASAKGQTRAVLDRVLDGVDGLLAEARPLPRLAHRRGVVAHTRIVLCRAARLAALFRTRDPLGQRVGLSAWQRSWCRWAGTARAVLRW